MTINTNEENCESSLNEILGCSASVIQNYFGEALFYYPNLAIYKSGLGLLAIVYRFNKVKDYVLYDQKGDIAFSSTRTIFIDDERMPFYQNKFISDFIIEYGMPHTDIGSGVSILAYLSNKPIVYMIKTLNKKIVQIAKFDFSQNIV